MGRAPHIAVLGSLHMDIVVTAERLPQLGETLPGETWRRVCGGKGLNQAVHAARHGANVRMIGCVGSDDFADQLLAYLDDHGIDRGAVRTTDEAGSGMSVATIQEDGDYAAVIVSGANLCLGDQDVAAVSAAPLDVLLLQYEVAPHVLAPAARAAKAAGARVILNAAPAAPAPEGLLEHVDVLVANEFETSMLTDIGTVDAHGAHKALSSLIEQVPNVIQTLGPQGLILAGPDCPRCLLPGFAVEVVDTHGAGDALIGALACRLAEGDDLLSAAKYGNAAAALMVATDGADPNAITRADVLARLQDGPEAEPYE